MRMKIAAVLFTLGLFPASAFAEAEMRGTVVKVDKTEKQLVVQTDKGEERLFLVGSSKGTDYAREGARVSVRFTEKDGQPKVIEITPEKTGTVNIVPR
jgi:hypothetical protein